MASAALAYAPAQQPVREREPIQWDELGAALWPDEQAALTRVLCCRHCRRPNRVRVPLAVMEPERHACAACGGRLFLGREEPLSGLAPQAYQHGLDRRTSAALESVPGLPRLARRVLESVGDHMSEMVFMADAIQCDEEQFPELVQLTERTRARLGLAVRPRVYVGESSHINALTTGARSPIVVVRSGLLHQMNDDELIAILGHELGHLHAGHAVHQALARALLRGGRATFSAIRVAGLPLECMLLRWLRHAELTADRAALLACRDLKASIATILALAGGHRTGATSGSRLRLGPFVRQCRELASKRSTRSFDALLGRCLGAKRTHPHVAVRVFELIRWVEHGAYLPILAGGYARVPQPPRARRGAPARIGRARRSA